jgi:hypothetical protein
LNMAQWSRPLFVVAHRHVGAAVEQQPHCGGLPRVRRVVDRSCDWWITLPPQASSHLAHSSRPNCSAYMSTERPPSSTSPTLAPAATNLSSPTTSPYAASSCMPPRGEHPPPARHPRLPTRPQPRRCPLCRRPPLAPLARAHRARLRWGGRGECARSSPLGTPGPPPRRCCRRCHCQRMSWCANHPSRPPSPRTRRPLVRPPSRRHRSRHRHLVRPPSRRHRSRHRHLERPPSRRHRSRHRHLEHRSAAWRVGHSQCSSGAAADASPAPHPETVAAAGVEVAAGAPSGVDVVSIYSYERCCCGCGTDVSNWAPPLRAPCIPHASQQWATPPPLPPVWW